ncbi:MAG TPA: TIR domain-containing protein [Ktedonobacteraceae bacterium]|nr:TIR domain-containing protein [Ktedonobacteraceae bacterium]
MTDRTVSSDALKDCFISYAHTDWTWAKWIARQLEEAGYSTVLPDRDFLAGSNLVLEMDSATKQAQRTIAVLSANYLASKFTPSEWAAAFHRDPKGEQGLLLLVRVQACDVPGLLGQLIYIDLVGKDEQKAQEVLLAGVQRSPRMLKQAPFPSHVAYDPPSFPGTLQAINRTHIEPTRFGAPFPEVWNVPRRHVPYFTGRDHLLQQLFQSFAEEGSAGMARPQALVGLGGLGKTQMAAEYAFRYRGAYQAVLWVRAETKEDLIEDFKAYARLLHLHAQESPIEAMQQWFRDQAGWLLVLDNADDLSLVAPFIPQAPRGHVLLTARARAAMNVAQPILLEPLGVEDGALCILRRTGAIGWNGGLSDASPLSVDAAQTLSRLMDGLPLALEQAGAYIEDTGSSTSRYLALYQRYRSELQQDQYGAVPNYRWPVASTWKISRGIVQQEQPAAFELLQLCALLAPDAIPEEIFTRGAAALGPVLGPIAAHPVSLDRATAFLRRYSLLNREVNQEKDADRFSIHHLMQETLRDEMDESTQLQWAERAVRAVALALPIVEWHIMQAHAHKCIQLIEQWNMAFPEAQFVQQYRPEKQDPEDK